ncbi:hypothetical protein YC2023_033404 [Brassica napus]
MSGTQLLDELAQAVRSLVQLYQLNYVRLDPRKGYFSNLNGNRQCEFRFPQFGARRRGGYGLLLLMATKRLIETMSGYMKDKLAALTAPMANAYANAVVFNKIINLVATFRHRKSTKTSSRFLPVNTKGHDKSYQNPKTLVLMDKFTRHLSHNSSIANKTISIQTGTTILAANIRSQTRIFLKRRAKTKPLQHRKISSSPRPFQARNVAYERITNLQHRETSQTPED